MTNADRIRQMTDEELAENFAESICNMIKECGNELACYECRLEWLRKEADEDAETD